MPGPSPLARTVLVPTDEESPSSHSWTSSPHTTPPDGIPRSRSMHLLKKSAHALGWNNRKKHSVGAPPVPSPPDSSASLASPISPSPSPSPTPTRALLDQLSLAPEGMTSDDSMVRNLLIERIRRLLVALDIFDAGIKSDTLVSECSSPPKADLRAAASLPSLDSMPTPPFPELASPEWRAKPLKPSPPILACFPPPTFAPPESPISPTPVQKSNPANVILPFRRSAGQRRGSVPSPLGRNSAPATSIASALDSPAPASPALNPGSRDKRREGTILSGQVLPPDYPYPRRPPSIPLPPPPTEATAAPRKPSRPTRLDYPKAYTRIPIHNRNKTLPNIALAEFTAPKLPSPARDPFAAGTPRTPLSPLNQNASTMHAEDTRDMKRLGTATERLKALQDRLKAESRARALAYED